MTPDEIYDTLTKLLRCMMCDGEWNDDRCRECECYLGENWNMFPFLWAVRGLIGQMKWIPVTEELPPADEWVLVTVENMLGHRWVERATYSHKTGTWSDGKYGISGVTAWMKMPDPYGGEENE